MTTQQLESIVENAVRGSVPRTNTKGLERSLNAMVFTFALLCVLALPFSVLAWITIGHYVSLMKAIDDYKETQRELRRH